MAAYAAVLTALAFSQSAGRMVADTKFDLVTDPARFLARSLHLWDPASAFGQIQNQAYGYAWPMGPFFLLGHVAQVPAWIIQRGWWSLLLCLAFFGIVRLARELQLGSPLGHVVAGFAYVLTPRITTLLGSSSVEIWPMALAPWVLVPLVRGSQRGSVRRHAALSALVVATCGGVNAIAVAAVLPLGVIWLLTRAAGPRKWPLLGWWTVFTGLATFWWWGPLLAMGKYSPPFLDYIENATVTTIPTDLARTFVGTSDWVAYIAPFDFAGGAQLVRTPFLLLDAAAIAALGLAGVVWPSNPQRRFLILGVITGLALVGLGYTGQMDGLLAADRQALFDGALAPLRNLHKFDVVLRIPLVLGFAHLVAQLPKLAAHEVTRGAGRVLSVTVAVVLFALTLPWLNNQIAPRNGIDTLPTYWSDVARYLHETDDGGVALEIPASAFGTSQWGNSHDEILQGLARSPWAVRNVIPLADPGNVTMLDRITKAIEGGRPDGRLADFLVANGVSKLIVRNELDRFVTASPDPATLLPVLASPGIAEVRAFGPELGQASFRYGSDGVTRLVEGDGVSAVTRAVVIYSVHGTDDMVASGASLLPYDGTTPSVLGDPGSDVVLAGDDSRSGSPVVLTDGLKKRESLFSAVRDNESATKAVEEGWSLRGPEHYRRIYTDQSRWQTTAEWTGGISGVRASSSQSDASAPAPLDIGAHPGAALDGDPSTAWQSSRAAGADGQWWQLDFSQSRSVPAVTVRLAAYSAPMARLRISNGEMSRTVRAPEPGVSTTFDVGLAPGPHLRITAVGSDIGSFGDFALSEVSVSGVQPQRWLHLPSAPKSAPVVQVSLSRDPAPAPCLPVGTAFVCSPGLRHVGEDGDTLARRFDLATGGPYVVTATGSLRRTAAAAQALLDASGVHVNAHTNELTDVADSPLAMIDGDPGTTWTNTETGWAQIDLDLGQRTALRTLELSVNPGAAVEAPRTLTVSSGRREAKVVLDSSGRGELPHWTTRRLRLLVQGTQPAFSVSSSLAGEKASPMPVGVSTLEINGAAPGALAGRPLSLACGSGPNLVVDGRVMRTSLSGPLTELLRGSTRPLSVCGSTAVQLSPGPQTVLATPGATARVDTLTLAAAGHLDAQAEPLALRRDDRGMPVSAHVRAESSDRVLVLAQNANVGWIARLDGHLLTRQRVGGWQQGWVLPAGAAGTVAFGFPADHTLRLLMLVGVVMLLIVVALAAVPARRRTTRPERALLPGRPGLLDLATVGVSAALVAGPVGLACVAGGLALSRLLKGVGLSVVAALLGLASSLALVWGPVRDAGFSQGWGQLVGVLLWVPLSAALFVLRSLSSSSPAGDVVTIPPAGSRRRMKPTFLRRISGRSKK